MNDGYERIPTSPEVWAVIRARHPEMLVYGSYSAPNGDPHGDSSRGEMRTSYGFRGANCPVIEARTTWTISPEAPHERFNEHHEYWLCVGIADDN